MKIPPQQHSGAVSQLSTDTSEALASATLGKRGRPAPAGERGSLFDRPGPASLERPGCERKRGSAGACSARGRLRLLGEKGPGPPAARGELGHAMLSVHGIKGGVKDFQSKSECV